MASTKDVLDLIASKHPEWNSTSLRWDPLQTILLDKWLKKGHTVEEAASALWSFVEASPYTDVSDKFWHTFGGGSHMYIINFRQAIGEQQPDVGYEERPPVYLAEQAVEYARQGWRFDGKTKFLDLASDYGKETFAKREAFAKVVPPSWAGTDPLLYWYLVLNEDIKSSLPDLGWRPDVLWKRYRGWSFQQYIDNFYAQRS